MKGLQKYLNDIQEELMDAVLYIQTAREELADKLTYEPPLTYATASDYDDEEED